MPSTATITTFYHFTSGTIYTSEVNNNFAAFRGHICPIDASLTALANLSYDLGSSDHAWRYAYTQGLITKGLAANTTPASGFYNLYPKTDGNWYSKNDAAAEKTIMFTDNTLTVTNKDIDGGTASNYNRITIPKNTTANITALTRKAGNIYYSTDENKFYGDNSTTLIGIGGGSWAVSYQTITSGGYISLTSGEVNQRITLVGATTTGVTLTSALFGASAPTDGTFVSLVGSSDTLPVYLVSSDTTYGAIGFGTIEFGYGVVGKFQYNNTLQRWIYG